MKYGYILLRKSKNNYSKEIKEKHFFVKLYFKNFQ